jgi:hypothetical protein
MAHYRGISNIDVDKDDAGFRAATRAAVEDYKATLGKPLQKPVRLKVAEMYVEVRNPIHDYIVVLES